MRGLLLFHGQALLSETVVRVSETQIKAYYNVCLHQGRLLRDGPSHNTELRCPFHGFCWTLQGKLAHFPSQWDFPQIDKSKFSLREVKVGPEHFDRIALAAMATPWVPRNPRKIDGPAQVREILDLAA